MEQRRLGGSSWISRYSECVHMAEQNRAVGPGNGQRNAHRPREAWMSAVTGNSIKARITQ